MRSPAGGAEPLPYAPQDTLSLGPAFSTARPGFFPRPRQGTRALPYKVLRYRDWADRVVRPYNPFVGADDPVAVPKIFALPYGCRLKF